MTEKDIREIGLTVADAIANHEDATHDDIVECVSLAISSKLRERGFLTSDEHSPLFRWRVWDVKGGRYAVVSAANIEGAIEIAGNLPPGFAVHGDRMNTFRMD